MTSSILEEAIAGRAFIQPWTVEQYHRAIENGFLPEDTRFELLDGFIVRKDRAKAGEDPMTIGDRHALVVQRLVRLASKFEGLGCHLRIQQPIAVPPINEPEPDACVVLGSEDDFADHRPEPADVFTVIEVADSSLGRDLGSKLRAYALAGIPQYIVVDLVNNVVLVHEHPHAGTYPPPQTHRRGETIEIRIAGSKSISLSVDRLLG